MKTDKIGAWMTMSIMPAPPNALAIYLQQDQTAGAEPCHVIAVQEFHIQGELLDRAERMYQWKPTGERRIAAIDFATDIGTVAHEECSNYLGLYIGKHPGDTPSQAWLDSVSGQALLPPDWKL